MQKGMIMAYGTPNVTQDDPVDPFTTHKVRGLLCEQSRAAFPGDSNHKLLSFIASGLKCRSIRRPVWVCSTRSNFVDKIKLPDFKPKQGVKIITSSVPYLCLAGFTQPSLENEHDPAGKHLRMLHVHLKARKWI
ncbi:hypothetical protein SELMODRAFT_426779 [Selaginella moellendorffii]|uniref:Uncharacterized protein n=1 Tax=Selaginella moellendorffii TaxID=88036 RepID=D8SXG7_SELML|nr:hypothetical protein SELMODRAFT_426779 [Selaginella moellendorffii]